MSNIVWIENEDGLAAYIDGNLGRRVTWAPQPGSQEAFLSCPIFEGLYEGTRGPGKTDTLLMDFAQHVGQGFGDKWRGVLFRRTYPELQDVIDKSLSWFSKIFPAARYNRSEHFWEWPDGEKLFLRHFKNEADYWSYHGHEYPWQGWEELTTWPEDKGYKKMFSCARSTHKGIPIKIRSTTNPYGVGHNWVKMRWRLPMPPGATVGKVIRDSRDQDGHIEPPRVAVHGLLRENRILMVADPEYINRIRAAARNKAELRAWIHGDWNIVAGGMFDDIWEPRVQVVPNLPFNKIPAAWRVDRSYDHGQSAPFSVGWWAESNGEPVDFGGRTLGPVPGDLFHVAEWYGWNHKPNEGLRMLSTNIARGIVEREGDWGIAGRVKPGPADTSIFDDFEPGKSVAGDMRLEGVNWTRADKGPGSRKQGWEQMRNLLSQSCGQREKPGLFIMQRCEQFIRTIPVLPRSDKDLDDVNTESEDHIGDMVRYRLRRRNVEATGGDM